MSRLDLGIDPSPEAAPVRWAFWKRGLALYLDVAVVELLGLGVGQVFFRPLTVLNYGGLLLGFAIALLYFGVGNSYLGQGQTPGKRLFGLRVIHQNGALLTVKQSCLRATLLVLTLFPFVRAAFYAVNLIDWVHWGQLIPDALSALSLYLFLFNRRTRQTAHDLLCGSYVVQTTSSTAVKSRKIWPWHPLIGLALAVAIALGLFQTNSSPLRLTPDPLEPVLVKQLQLRSAQVFESAYPFNGARPTQLLRVVLVPDAAGVSADQLAARAARILFSRGLKLDGVDTVVITVKSGYRLGIATGYREFNYRYCPQAGGGRLDQRFDARLIANTPMTVDLILNADRNYQPIFMKLPILELGDNPRDMISPSYNPMPFGRCKVPARQPSQQP